MTRHVTADTAAGRVRGIASDGLATFNAIPYAAPPLGPLRFGAPRPHPGWTGVRDCIEVGASPPQGPSRLDAVMGIAPFRQSEDCLTLTVWTPGADGGKRPVLYWLHGGAYQSGGAHQVFYDGGTLARACDIVVVGVNYRLGALGYLHLPETDAPANRGLLDQIAALTWVRDNIAGFGGDPANITICGQSAGGGSVLALLADADARRLVAKAIPMSASTGNLTRERADEIAACFCEHAGVAKHDLARLREMPAEAIVAAQRKVQLEIAATGDRTIAYQNMIGGPRCPQSPAAAVMGGAAKDIPILIGSTLDEGHAWLAQDDKLVAETRLDVIMQQAEAGGFAKAGTDLPQSRRRPGERPWHLMSAMMTWAVFEKPARRIAESHARHGGAAYVYRFDWRPTPDARFGACHCIELPFMFHNFDKWPAAAMMEGHDPAAYQALAARMRDAWGAFARHGKPGHAALPAWQPWSATATPTMTFDATCRVATDAG